jgi:hypothetical protein
MDYLASMYIDNELNLEEKIWFIDRIIGDLPFYQDTRELLHQEKLLRITPDASMIPAHPPKGVAIGDWLLKFLKPVIYATGGFALAGLLLIVFAATPVNPISLNRFVIYEPDASQVELVGSFTDWKKTAMMPIGNSGYWELRLELPFGEHRFAYILDGSKQITDPTLPVREKDDFGGENSILTVVEPI